MKAASTNDATEAILIDVCSGSAAHPIAKLEYWNGSAWVELEDVLSVNVSKTNRDDRYGRFVLVPPAMSMSVTMDNAAEKYSPGSGGAFDGVLVRNLKVRASLGYDVGTDEYSQQGVFYLDDPQYTSSHSGRKVNFSARDALKKAIESSVTLSTITATDCAVILRNVCDAVGIPHNSGVETIPTTSHAVTIVDADNFKNMKAVDVFSEVMQYLFSKNQLYRLQMVDGNLSLIEVEDDISNSDWQIDYRYNTESQSRGLDSDQIIQRVHFETQSNATAVETILAFQIVSTTQTNTDLSWSLESKFIRVTAIGATTFTLNYVDLAAKKINYSSTGSFTLNIYGCVLSGARVGYFGEAISYTNQQAGEGQIVSFSNRLIQSDAEAKTLADIIKAQFEAPAYRVTAALFNANTLLEIGDRLLVWDKYTYTNTIFQIEGITIDYQADGAKLSQRLEMVDLGIDGITPFIWDKNGIDEGTGDLVWDKGQIWDQDLGVGVTEDTTDYDYLKPLEFT
jgi:hypothetical protein